MPQRNRDRIMQQSLYDFLTDMNENFTKGDPHCVLEAIEGSPRTCPKESCNECIAEWLNSFPF